MPSLHLHKFCTPNIFWSICKRPLLNIQSIHNIVTQLGKYDWVCVVIINKFSRRPIKRSFLVFIFKLMFYAVTIADFTTCGFSTEYGRFHRISYHSPFFSLLAFVVAVVAAVSIPFHRTNCAVGWFFLHGHIYLNSRHTRTHTHPHPDSTNTNRRTHRIQLISFWV